LNFALWEAEVAGLMHAAMMLKCVYPAHCLTLDLSVVNKSNSGFMLPRSTYVTAF
jgi:hypothetical protein